MDKRRMNTRLTLSRITRTAMLVTLNSALLVGCANLSAPSHTTANTDEAWDTETVFLYQSRMASGVMDRVAELELDGASTLDPILVAADARMTDICRHLNEAAVARAEGRTLGLDLKLRVVTSKKACARAAREVELLLSNAGDSVQTAKL